MGNIESKRNFGSIYGTSGVVRPGYYIGKDTLIYQGVKIPLMQDERDFKKLKFGYLKTNKRVFFKGKPIIEANPKTFSTITRDNVKNVSTNSQKISDLVKLNSVLGMDFYGNKKRIFHKDKIIYTE